MYNRHSLVNAILGSKYAEDFDRNIDLQSLYMDDVAPPTLKLSDAKLHASFSSSFLLHSSLQFGVNGINSFQSS